MNHKNIAISCLSCLLILVAVIWIGYWQFQDLESVQTADNCEQLALYIDFSTGIEKVNIWQSQEEIYYFFLPAGAEFTKITFGNLDDGDSVSLNGTVFGRKDDLREFVSALTPEQTLELVMKAEGQEQETVQVRFMQSANLAAMFIETASGSVESIHANKGAKEAAFMQLLDSEGQGCFSGNLDYIKTRGNTSWDNDKKPYQIKLEKEAELLGMPSARRWILLANFVDDTLMKNELVYRYAERYSAVPSINGQYVDLYVNGNYVGNYYLCEKIEVGRNRLDITDLEAATEKINYDSSYEEASLYVSGCVAGRE